MAGRASAFAVLGLEPGADGAAIDLAFRRLMKRHHPDREGGDAARAAEIIRAYRELRGGKALRDPLQFNQDLQPRRKAGKWSVAAAFLGAGLGAAMLLLGPSVPVDSPTSAAGAGAFTTDGRRPDAMDAPLHAAAIDEAIGQAVHLYRTKDEMALTGASRECQRRFREKPGTLLLDRCAAFDDAVIGLQDRDPLRDGGPFAPLAVTGRQWSAASSLSDDYLAIDGRLDRIRLRVELALVPNGEPEAPGSTLAGR